MDIIFFHGLQFEHNSDAYLATWRCGDVSQEVWPQRWLPVKYPQARIISVSYDAFIRTTSTEGRMDMHLIGENVLLEILGVRKEQGKECIVILVGHSFGGLVIKELCVSANFRSKEESADGQHIREFLDSIRGILFYGTPHRGFDKLNVVSRKHSVMNHIPANKPLLRFVEPLGPDAARLHEKFERTWLQYDWLIFGVGESHPIKGQRKVLVPEGSSRFGNRYITVECDHFSVCRPISKTCNRYLQLVDLIDILYAKSQDERRQQEKVWRNVVGAEFLLTEVQKHLREHTFLGFWGMGGVGKTTLAWLAFNTLSAKFEYTCFVRLSEVKLIQGNKEKIKKKIWKNVRRHGQSVRSEDMWTEVRRKKLLVVFDDIDKREQVDLLQEIADDNASKESRFITTSRNAELLRLLKGTYIYHVPFLKHEVAKELFSIHAFPDRKEPPARLKHNVEEVVKGCAGLPLTLEVLGKYLGGLSERDDKIWDEVIDAVRNAGLHRTLEETVWKVLQLSYDGMEGSEKDMFLDIASFLLLESCPFSFEEARSAWSSMYDYVHTGWKILVDRSLVQEIETEEDDRLVIASTTEHGVDLRKVHMHEHMKKMGLRIAKESRRNFSVIDDQWGDTPIPPQRVVALRAHFSVHSNGDIDRSDENSRSPCKVQKIFSQLNAVRYLDLTMRPPVSCGRCNKSECFSLPTGLVMLRWEGSNANLKLPLEASVCRSLVVLRLDRDDDCCLDIISSEACGYLSRLERLTMKSSQLIRLPHAFGYLRRLKHLTIYDCVKLEGLPKTFGNLSSLEHMRIWGCSGLERLPETFGRLNMLRHLEIKRCRKLEGLPENFGNLSNLEHLEIEECDGLERLLGTFGGLTRLNHLKIGLREFLSERLKGLPETFGNLTSLEYMSIWGCYGLERLPKTFGNLAKLKHLEIKRCERLEGLPETFGKLSSLEHLQIIFIPLLERLPENFVDLGRLKHLEIHSCWKLEELPETFGNLSSLEQIEIVKCDVLRGLPDTFGSLGRLKQFKIRACDKLEGLAETFGKLSTLEYMRIWACNGLERLPKNFGNLGMLKRLEIRRCRKLEGLPDTFANLSRLEHMMIWGCDGLERLPETFGHLSKLKHLDICMCDKLDRLPETFGSLSSLEYMDISMCPVLESLPDSFGNLGRLKHLVIGSCWRLKGLPDTFGNLRNLERMEIRCDGLERLPESFGNLGTLEHLKIDCCDRLQRLPERFGNLSSLEHIEIESCEQLERLPGTFGNLGMLKHVEIKRCRKLEGLLETVGNLSNLEHVQIEECDGLERFSGDLEKFRQLEEFTRIRLTRA